MVEDDAAPLHRAEDVTRPALVRATPSFSRWYLLLVGALAGVTWVGAVALDLTLTSHLSGWLRILIHATLVLLVPLFVVFSSISAGRIRRSLHQQSLRHAFSFYLVETLLLVVTALPAIFPFGTPSDLLSLPLRVPTLALGVALATVDPQVITRLRNAQQAGSSPIPAMSLGFGAVLILTGLTLLAVSIVTAPQTTSCSGLGCAAVASALQGYVMLAIVGCPLVSAIVGLIGIVVGYELGALIASSPYYEG